MSCKMKAKFLMLHFYRTQVNLGSDLWVHLSVSPPPCVDLTECDISVSKLLGFETFPFVLMVSVSVSKIFGIEKSIGIGFEKIWYRKKYRYRFRKKLVSKKVSVSVSKNFGIKKSIGSGFEKIWYRKSIGIGSEIFCIEKGHKYS